ncbi:MAG: 4-alpha-glucanotransferase [Defluviitaleaceae bacterium]|nr:4-alpha-glucanotransferase [Defluviitaleaceae bacterium]MCL2262792.1 4-alpha-glucanotransferase [Defluviitaleaceae bacterium]
MFENMKNARLNENPRASGVLVHPTSFPGHYGIGDLGWGAYKFVDFLKDAKQKLWQVLPLGPTGFGDSPYQSFSSFAGNHYLISPDKLHEQGWLTQGELVTKPWFDPRAVDFGPLIKYKMRILRQAFNTFKAKATAAQKSKVTTFCKKNADWLEDYALFYAIKEHFGGKEWQLWPKEIAKREPKALAEIREKLEDSVNFCKFLQYEFFTQWDELKAYANDAGVSIIGDIPIFVAGDSADVWANPELYMLDATGRPTAVAGVPPDYFSATGQLWGNPLYDWDVHKKTGFAWWFKRVESVLSMVDIIRIDHFRGFESFWAIPAGEETAINGKWMKGPGKTFFTELKKKLGNLPIIAEDLGEITDAVNKLRTENNLPGMRVLHFAFDPSGKSTHMPHNYEDSRTVVYSGTHDNNTTVGWYNDAHESERDYLRRSLSISGNDVAWDLIRFAISTNALYAIAPIQDIMCLDAHDRMNCPGLAQGWWKFRYTEDMLTHNHSAQLRYLTEMFNRD